MMKSKRYVLALDLVDDPEKIQTYIKHHKNVWPEVEASLAEAGINQMEIYLTGNRLVMIIEVVPDFSFEKKKQMDDNNPKVQEWEELMGSLQLPLPWAPEGIKWLEMDRVYRFNQM